MAPMTWNFVLPTSGQHVVTVNDIGTSRQKVELDGQLVSHAGLWPGAGVEMVGPDGCALELRKGKGGVWTLLVGGTIVEDYHSIRSGASKQDQTLRELRSRPDGSYIISTGFDAASVSLHVVRKFAFRVHGVAHEVQMAHWDCIWQVILDDIFVDRVKHKLFDNDGVANFSIPSIPGCSPLPAVMRMTWLSQKTHWEYRLIVAGVVVPHSWSKIQGVVTVQPPDITPDIEDNAVLEAPPPEEADDMAAPEADFSEVQKAEAEAQRQHHLDEVLPQGVSRDAATGGYQANIRAKSGKFVFLGEFCTPDEAHRRYLEVLPVYWPGRAPVAEPPCP